MVLLVNCQTFPLSQRQRVVLGRSFVRFVVALFSPISVINDRYKIALPLFLTDRPGQVLVCVYWSLW